MSTEITRGKAEFATTVLLFVQSNMLHRQEEADEEQSQGDHVREKVIADLQEWIETADEFIISLRKLMHEALDVGEHHLDKLASRASATRRPE